MSSITADLRHHAARSPALGAARRQVGVASAQWVAGIGNLGFALVAARVLTPSAFAELGAFLSGYVLLHLPAAGIGAGAALSPTDVARRRRRLLAAGAAVGAALVVAAPPLAHVFAMQVATVLALAAAAPGAALLGLERGMRFGTGGHGRVAAGLVAEPLTRLLFGVAAATVLGAPGAAVAVTGAGYVALALTRGSAGAPGIIERAREGRTGTTLAFILFAVLQQQDLLVAKLRLAPHAAGTFTMLSTAGGAVAFATATVPLALLPTGGRSRHDDRIAIALTIGVGATATLLAAAAGEPLLGSLFGPEYGDVAGLFPAYVAAMGMLGLGRVLAARSCTRGGHRRAALVVGALVTLHLALLFATRATPRGLVTATFAATTIGVGVLVTPPGLVREAVRRARSALAAWASGRELALLGGLTVVAVVVRLVATRGLWVDEAITVAQAQLPFGEMLHQLRSTDVHPPLHHSMVWVLVRLLGTSETVVRLPSILAGAALVPVVHGLGKALYGRRTAAIAAALTSVAPFLVWYSQEARMYSLLVLFATASLWAQVVLIRRGGRWAWVAYVLTAAAMVWTQWFAAVPLLAEQLLFLAAVIHRHRQGGQAWALARRWLSVLFAVALLCAPLVPFAADQLGSYTGRHDATHATAGTVPTQVGSAASSFSDEVSVYAVGANAIWAVAGYHSDTAMTQLAALWPLLLLAGLGALGRGRSRSTEALLLCVLLPAAVFVLAGSVKRDLFELRYFAAVVPLVLLLGARTITAVLRRRSSQAIAASLVVAALSVALVDQQTNGANPRRYDFEGALQTVRAEARPGDTIVFAPDYLAEVVDYYGNGIDAHPVDELGAVGHDDHVWVVATTRVANEVQTSAVVGRALATLEQDDRRVVSDRHFPNVQLWELDR